MKTALILAGVAAALAAFECGSQYLKIRTDLSAQRKAARDEWSGVGEAMERRAALISRLASSEALGEGERAAALPRHLRRPPGDGLRADSAGETGGQPPVVGGA